MEHGLRYLANCSILFTELPLLERPAAAKTAGFDAVEFWWPFPESTPSDAAVNTFVAVIENAGVQLVGLNFAAGDMPGGDRGLLSWPGRETEFLDSVDIAVGIAGQLGTTAFNALYGNRIDGASAGQQDELAANHLTAAAVSAKSVNAVVLVEPVSCAPRYPLLAAADVIGVLDRVEGASGVDNLRLLADFYHLSVNGDDLTSVLADHSERIGHVQIADAPGRHEPGTGDLDLDTHLCALESAGYTGWVGLEYKPSQSTETSFRWLPRDRRGDPAHALTAASSSSLKGDT